MIPLLRAMGILVVDARAHYAEQETQALSLFDGPCSFETTTTSADSQCVLDDLRVRAVC